MGGPMPPDYELTRPRDAMDDFFLVKYPYIMFLLTAIYIWFVKKGGPAFMAKRRPYNVTSVVRVYNIIQIICNAYVVSKLLIISPNMMKDYMTHYCHYFNTEDNPTFIEMATLCNFIVFTKVLDFSDSVFIILRKKFNQLSFLHYYHHGSVAIIAAFNLSEREGVSLFVSFLNAFVHLIMYTYYFLSSIKSMKQTTARFRQSLTTIQIVQFLIMLTHLGIAWYRQCSMGLVMTVLLPLLIASILVLFVIFYIQNYMKPKPASEKSKHDN